MARAKVKANTSKMASAKRRSLFKAAYMTNGHNATQAAITAGFSAKTAASQGARLLKRVEISGELAEAARKAEVIAGLDVERTLREVARVAYFDPRKLYRPDDSLKSPSEWDDESAAVVASVESLEEFDGTGEDRQLIGHTKKLKLWDKNAALEKAMKHHGLYDKDNAQKGENLSIKIVLVK